MIKKQLQPALFVSPATGNVQQNNKRLLLIWIFSNILKKTNFRLKNIQLQTKVEKIRKINKKNIFPFPFFFSFYETGLKMLSNFWQ